MTAPDVIRTLDKTALAAAINSSSLTLGLLSGAHLIGYVIVVGSALVSSFRLLGWMLRDRPASQVLAATVRLQAIGLAVSVTAGVLLFIPRSAAALGNWIFQLKLALLVAAVLAQASVQAVLARGSSPRPPRPRVEMVLGALSLLLWVSVALAGCAFILIE